MMYTALAPLYDRIMSHVNYALWLDLIQKIISRYFPNPNPSILELGGGTGSLAKLLLHKGFSYCGSDYSFAMCRQARKKEIPFFCADARRLPVKKSFSFIIFLYDGINYFRTLDDYKCFFDEIYSHLDRDGYFLFDITTEANSKTNFPDITDTEDFGESSYIRHSYFDKKTKIQYNDFTIYTKSSQANSLYEKRSELHDQKIFSVDEIIYTIPKNLFSVVGIWDNFSLQKYNNKSERIHFLIKKKVLS